MSCNSILISLFSYEEQNYKYYFFLLKCGVNLPQSVTKTFLWRVMVPQSGSVTK